VLRHRVAEPEAVAAPPRAPPHHAALPLPKDADVKKVAPSIPVFLLPSPLDVAADDLDGPGLASKDSRDSSFRFQNIDLPDSWL